MKGGDSMNLTKFVTELPFPTVELNLRKYLPQVDNNSAAARLDEQLRAAVNQQKNN